MVPCGFAEDGGLNSKVKALALGLHTGLWTTLGGLLFDERACNHRKGVVSSSRAKEQDSCLLSVILGVLSAQMSALCLQGGACLGEP